MKFLKVFLISIPVSIITYLIYIIAISFDSIQNFNGICPAAPTDIPAYPCTFEEFLIRIFFSPWAIMVSIMIFPFWFLVHFIFIYIVFRIFGKNKR
ncbi:MAG: hypothetical protein KBA66_07160 [Leptospiraceae bacterium]|nr:hypothetical protein [Leptospiraceae bacterium]